MEVGCLAPACYAKVNMGHLVARTLCYATNVRGNRRTNTSGRREKKKQSYTSPRAQVGGGEGSEVTFA